MEYKAKKTPSVKVFGMLIMMFLPFGIVAQTANTNGNLMASFGNEWGCVVSKPSSNTAVVFAYPTQGTPDHYRPLGFFPAEEPVIIGFCSTTERDYESLRLAPEYAFRISARSEDGEVVGTTKLGASYGKRFDEVNGYDKNELDRSGVFYEGCAIHHYYAGGRPFWTIARPHAPTSVQKVFPPPGELFKFNKLENIRCILKFSASVDRFVIALQTFIW